MKKRPPERPCASVVRRRFDRARAADVFVRNPFVSPRQDGKCVPLSPDEITTIEGLWNGGEIRHGRVFVEERKQGIYAHYWYWNEDPNYPHIYGRTMLTLQARGVVEVKYDGADNAVYVFSPDAARWMEAMTKVRMGRVTGPAAESARAEKGTT